MVNDLKIGRDFEVAKGYENKDINLPYKSTIGAAGYDFESAVDIVIPSIWTRVIKKFVLRNLPKDAEVLKPVLVPTGVKAYMEKDEALFLLNRSSNPLKLFLILSNSVGLIDMDYYSNEKNDGDIMFQFINFGFKDLHIKKGDRIGQGVFKKVLFTNTDRNKMKTRKGGHGSTNE